MKSRRSFLQMLGLAPVAAVAAKAGVQPAQAASQRLSVEPLSVISANMGTLTLPVVFKDRNGGKITITDAGVFRLDAPGS